MKNPWIAREIMHIKTKLKRHRNANALKLMLNRNLGEAFHVLGDIGPSHHSPSPGFCVRASRNRPEREREREKTLLTEEVGQGE